MPRSPRGWRASSARRSAVSTADFNGDGWTDVLVANNEQENQLWINKRDGSFNPERKEFADLLARVP
jgi:hypothetical protein